MAVPSLEALLKSKNQVVAVVSQPDKPSGRGLEIHASAVSQVAIEHKIPLLQPVSLKNDPDFLRALQELAPDLIVVVAYGKILPPEVLTLPPRRCINVHFSLLPKYRGAAPVQWALINEEEETGVTTFFLTDKLDTGPILMQRKIPIHEEDNAKILGHRLAIAGAELLIETVEALGLNQVEPVPQNERLATFAPPLKKEDGQIDWSEKAKTIQNRVRGMTPWPGAFTFFKGKRLKVHHTELLAGRKGSPAGEILVAGPERLEVACGQGALLISELQLEGGKRLTTSDFLKGHPIAPGERLG